MAKRRPGVCCAAHFLVDLACALLVLGRVCPAADGAACILVYNAFAFALQMPLGLLADRLGRCGYFAAGGCGLTALGWLLPPGLCAAAAAGLGNACFHVGGGLDALRGSEKAGPLGLFVAPGALGVFLGGKYAAAAPALVLPACLTMLLTAAALLLWCGNGPAAAAPALPRGGRIWIAAACLLAVVILRSRLGLAAELPWKREWGLALACAAAGGKAAGGLLADRFGAKRAALVSLVPAALCYLGADRAAPGLAAVFLFNMTMPLTLWALARRLPGAKGFAFGLLTFGLFLGFLPGFFGADGLGPPALAAGALVSLLLLLPGLPREGKP